MKEIDFLPEWYKSGKRRQVNYRTQCFVLGGIFLVMMVWSCIATHSISRAKAESAQLSTRQTEAKSMSAKLEELKSELRGLQKKTEFMKEIDSKIDVGSVLAEISSLIDKRIILSKVEFVAERFVDKQKTKSSQNAGTVVRTARTEFSEKRELPLGDVRFKVLISGVAADASDVAALICKLEDSPYFRHVVPSFSRNAELEAKSTPSAQSKTSLGQRDETIREDGGKIQVSEFEISCYLANYHEQ